MRLEIPVEQWWNEISQRNSTMLEVIARELTRGEEWRGEETRFGPQKFKVGGRFDLPLPFSPSCLEITSNTIHYAAELSIEYKNYGANKQLIEQLVKEGKRIFLENYRQNFIPTQYGGILVHQNEAQVAIRDYDSLPIYIFNIGQSGAKPLILKEEDFTRQMQTLARLGTNLVNSILDVAVEKKVLPANPQELAIYITPQYRI